MTISLLQAMDDPNLFAPWFKDRASWTAWRAFIAALFGYPMTEEEFAIYRECTGRDERPEPGAVREAWLICGRRGGKSFTKALIAVYLACFHEYRPYLSPGERGVVVVTAADRKQARSIFRYAQALITQVPMLAEMVETLRADEIDLNNSVTLEIGTASYRSVRGKTIVAALNDEIAFWRSEDSANPDEEILDAQRPAMATIPNAIMLCGSSPHARRGVMWDAYDKAYGKADADRIVWKAPTDRMNPRVDRRIIAKAYADDPAKAKAEYGAEFRTDVEAFLTREAVEAVTDKGVTNRTRAPGSKYIAFVDPSGGSSDAMTLAIGHRDPRGKAILDVAVERKAPFSPEAVVDEFCALLKAYGITSVTGDRYGGEFCREPFRLRGIRYDISEKSRSEIYLDLLPAINSGNVALLDNERLALQLVGLERRTARGGRDSIDHPRGAHDDLANAVAGCLVLLQPGPRQPMQFYVYTYEGAPISENAFAIAHEHWKAREDMKRSYGL